MPFRVMWSSCRDSAKPLEKARNSIPFISSCPPASYRTITAIVVFRMLYKAVATKGYCHPGDVAKASLTQPNPIAELEACTQASYF